MQTKRDLRAGRRHALDAWLNARDTRLDESAWWTAALRDAEAAEFARLDAVYETAKRELARGLSALPSAELAEYFAALGWQPVGETKGARVNDYIARG